MTEILNFLIAVRNNWNNRKIKHCLSDSVLLIFFARLAGAEYWEDLKTSGKPTSPLYIVFLS